MRTLALEARNELLDWLQGRLFRTLSLMFRSPGEQTCEYLRGKRASYISPTRLFVVAFGLYFILIALLQPQDTSRVMEPLEAPRGQLSDRFEALGDYLSEFGELIERGEVALSPGQVAAAKIYSGGAILFLVPWLALLLRVTDWRCYRGFVADILRSCAVSDRIVPKVCPPGIQLQLTPAKLGVDFNSIS